MSDSNVEQAKGYWEKSSSELLDLNVKVTTGDVPSPAQMIASLAASLGYLVAAVGELILNEKEKVQ